MVHLNQPLHYASLTTLNSLELLLVCSHHQQVQHICTMHHAVLPARMLTHMWNARESQCLALFVVRV